MVRTLLFIWILAALSGAAAAQTISTTPTPAELDAVIRDLKTRPIVDNPILAIRELDRLESLENRLRAYENRRESDAQLVSEFESSRRALETFSQTVVSTNCATSADAAMIVSDAPDIAFAISDLPVETGGIDRLLDPLTRESRTCASIKAALANPQIRPALDAIAKAIAGRRADDASVRQKASEIAQLIASRREDINKRVSAESTRTGLKNSLWAVILVIGLLSIGAIWVVRTFPPELQIEWVTSGQVIQFVTVMILLSVIMALGLSDILKENTLGTLLGGIAGYVLSQGVGRAAAQAVSRTVAQTRDGSARATTPVNIPAQ